MAAEAEVALALREARDKAVADALKEAEEAVSTVTDPGVPLSYGARLVQIRTAALAKLWQKVYAPRDQIGVGPRTDRAQINSARLHAAEARHIADQLEAERQPSGDDIGDVLIHAIRQAEIKPYREFADAVDAVVAPLLAEV
jgi:hypothetical protein